MTIYNGWCVKIRSENSNLCRIICRIGLLILIFSAVFCPAAADYTIDLRECESVSAGLDRLPENAGIVTVLLTKETPDKMISIPADKGITEIRFLPADESKVITLLEIERICAGGIPLTLGNGLDLINTSIYGGACVSGKEARLEASSVRISGSAGFVFGGGFAENRGVSVVENPSVSLDAGGQVYYEVFGGGHAYGEESKVSSEVTSVTILGTADYVLGAGFAEDGGFSECVGTDVNVGEGASVKVALFAGGSASGEGSLSTVDSPFARLEGFANWAFSGDFAFGGGKTRTDQSGRLEVLSTGSSGNAFLGSFASDEGSNAYINTAELMNCGTVELITQHSQSSDGADAVTQYTANFPCSAE